MPDHLTVRRDGGVATLIIDRPGAHNSLTPALLDDLVDATTDLLTDDAVRCLVLTGAGPAFCAGADLGMLAGDGSDEARVRALATRLHVLVRDLVTAPKPVVTGVNGVAAGGGLGPALAGDLVLAAEDARFEFAYPRIGLSGDGGSTWLLPRLVGLRRATGLVLRDDPVGAGEAVELGLASEVVPSDGFEARLADVAADLADGPTRAYGETKALLARSVERGLERHLADETRRIARLTGTADYARGLAAFGTDEEPAFEGR